MAARLYQGSQPPPVLQALQPQICVRKKQLDFNIQCYTQLACIQISEYEQTNTSDFDCKLPCREPLHHEVAIKQGNPIVMKFHI